MTYYFGLPEHEFKQCDHVDRAPLTADHLATASRRLRALAYVGFAEDADRLPSDLRRVWPDVFKAVPDGACSLESENPTHYGSLPRSPDAATRALIEAANVHDIALYRGARASWRRTEVLQESAVVAAWSRIVGAEHRGGTSNTSNVANSAEEEELDPYETEEAKHNEILKHAYPVRPPLD